MDTTGTGQDRGIYTEMRILGNRGVGLGSNYQYLRITLRLIEKLPSTVVYVYGTYYWTSEATNQPLHILASAYRFEVGNAIHAESVSCLLSELTFVRIIDGGGFFLAVSDLGVRLG